MRRNNAECVRELLRTFAQDDDLTLTWDRGQAESPFNDPRPAQLIIKTPDGILLGSINNLQDGFDTVLEALSCSKADYKKKWRYNYNPSKIRIRWSGDKFAIRSIR